MKLGQSAEPAPGDVLAGRYRIEGVLGRGGMGLVVAARDAQSGGRVAIKLLHGHQLRNATTVERFFREARATLRIRSEHVSRVFDVAHLENGAPFIVMEYLNGSDLGIVLKRRGSLPVGEAVSYAIQACIGCADAHAAGIVHRDLKPSNLFLVTRPDGTARIKLVDFGISQVSGLSGTVGHALTASGDLTGSPLYMAPEQLRSRPSDARVDLWAIGVTLYELLVGSRPFQGGSMLAECNSILQAEAPPPSSLRPEIPPGLDAVLLRCLAKDPSERWSSAVELKDALMPYASTMPRSQPAPPPRRPRRRLALAAALLGMLALAGAAFWVEWYGPGWTWPPQLPWEMR
jgi:serine/threonine protein kinase